MYHSYQPETSNRGYNLQDLKKRTIKVWKTLPGLMNLNICKVYVIKCQEYLPIRQMDGSSFTAWYRFAEMVSVHLSFDTLEHYYCFVLTFLFCSDNLYPMRKHLQATVVSFQGMMHLTWFMECRKNMAHVLWLLESQM